MRSSTVPARVSQTRSRYPLRWLRRSGRRSPCAAPVTPSTSSSISRCAAKPTISRSNSASELFSNSVRRLIISSVIVGSSVRLKGLQPNPTGALRCPPPWISSPPPPDSWGPRRRATYPQLLHHPKGHDLGHLPGLPRTGDHREQTHPLQPLNADTGNRLRQQLVDAETGEVVERDRPAAPLPWPRSFRPAVANDANLMIPKDAALILSSALPFLATRSRTNF